MRAGTLIRYVAVVVVFVAGGCESTTPKPRSAQTVQQNCPPSSNGIYMLPEDAVSAYDTESGNEMARDDFARLLDAADLAPLWCGAGADEAYRLLFFPSFRPAVIVEARSLADAWSIEIVEFSDPRTTPTTGERFTVARRDSRRLSQVDAHILLTALKQAGYWTVPASRRKEVHDGARWAIEGRERNAYRIVTRINADDEPFEETARVFVRLAGWEVPPEMAPRPK